MENILSVSLDFDGTITKSSHYGQAGYNEIQDLCRPMMVSLSKMGVKFYLLTGRQDEYLPEALELCKKWKLPIDTSTPTRKRITDFYIDDKNLGCKGIDWTDIYQTLKSELIRRQIAGCSVGNI